MFSLQVNNENHIQTIQCTKNINGTVSLVEAMNSIQQNTSLATGHFKIQLDHVDV